MTPNNNNDNVVISKRMFNLLVCIIFFLLSSVLTLIGMIWKLNKNFEEEKKTNWKNLQEQGTQIQDLQEITKLEGQTIEILLNKLEQINKNCCNQQAVVANTPNLESKTNPKAKQRSGSDCMVGGINVCIPLITRNVEKTPEPTTQNETQLTF
jgi:Na+/phosphate symporter